MNKTYLWFLYALSLLLVLNVGILFFTEENDSISTSNYVSDNLYEDKYLGYKNNSLISIFDLEDLINNEDTRIIAVISNRLDKYIPNSNVININNISNVNDGFVINEEQLSVLLSNIGIRNNQMIILYDDSNNIYSSRLWWTLKLYGHKNVKIIDGGLKKWKNNAFDIDPYPDLPTNSKYTSSKLNNDIIASIDDINKSITNKHIIIDTRMNDEYKKGHIYSSINISWDNFIHKDGTFKSYVDIKEILSNENINEDDNIIIYSKDGNTASLVYFVLSELAGYKNVKLFEGSWLEYSKSN